METYRSVNSGFEDVMPIKFYGTTEKAHVLSLKQKEVL